MLIIIIPAVIVVIVSTLFVTNYLSNVEPSFAANAAATPLAVTSSAFDSQASIPLKYTGDGQNINPPLKIEGIPQGAKSLVIIMDDLSIPLITWNHWAVWNIPPNATVEVNEKSEPGVVGRNSWRNNSYGGPDPPFGSHTYNFKVYALDIVLDLNADAGKSAVLKEMNNHVLSKGALAGVYP